MQRLCMCIVVIEKKGRGETWGACNTSQWVWNPSKALMTAIGEAIFPKVKWCWKVIQNLQVLKHSELHLNWRCRPGRVPISNGSPGGSPHLSWGERLSQSPKSKTLRYGLRPGVPISGAPRAAQVSVGSGGALGSNPDGAGRGGLGSRGSGARGAGSGTRWGGSALAHLAADTSCNGSK